MRLRDRPYAGASVIYVVDGLADAALDRLPEALSAYVLHPASIEVRDSLGRAPRDSDVAAAVEEAVVRIERYADVRDLIARARALGYGRLPVRVVIAGGTLVVNVHHGVMDGGAILELVTWLVSVSSGADGKRDTRTPLAFPLVHGLRKVGRAGLEDFRANRRTPQPEPVLTHSPTDADLRLETARFGHATLGPDELRRLIALPAGGPTTVMSRVASLAVGAARRLYTGERDVPVIVPVDSRRFVKNARVLGNFMGVAAPAALLASDWSPAAIAARSKAALRGGGAMVSTAHALARWIAHRPKTLLRRSPRPGPGTVAVFVPMLGLSEAFLGAAWREGASPWIGGATVSAWPSGTALSLLAAGDEYQISAWDESGLFEVSDRTLAEALAAELAEREVAAGIGPAVV
ncbi:MAG: hypothetical protein JWQ92_2008 [Amnibacterium sp.]|nr:hypothetical protein [Amnibacterium sp.]